MLFITDSVNLDIVPDHANVELSHISVTEVMACITAKYQDAAKLEAAINMRDSVIIWTSLIHDSRIATLVSNYVGLDIGVNSSFDPYRQIDDTDTVIVCKIQNDRSKRRITFYQMKIKG